MEKIPQPTLASKVGAAFYVLSMRPELPGVRTINTLMWPYMVPPLLQHEMEADDRGEGPWILEPDDIRRHAARLLASVHAALLEGALPQRSAQIWTEQAESLADELEPEPQDERIPSRHGRVLHPPANIADWISAFSGPCRHRRQGT